MARYGTVLVVEDSPLIAMDAEETLRSSGFRRVLATGSQHAALSIASAEALDFAFVAAKTFDGEGARVAARLAERRIPFAFSCAFADGSDLPVTWLGAPYLVRPFSEKDLAALFERLGF